MQSLRGPPGPVIPVFAQVFDYQSHIFEIADARFGMAKPKTLRVAPDQSGRPLDQFRRRRGGRGKFVQFIGCAGHAGTVTRPIPIGKKALTAPGHETEPSFTPMS